MTERSALQALLAAKCPRCRQGELFLYPGYKLTKFDKMPEYCPHCNLRYEVEPGFWYGAMYVSYAITTGIVLVMGFVLYQFFNDPPTWVYVTSVAVIIVLPMPYVFRVSRILYLYLFSGVTYNEQMARKRQS